MKDGTRKTIVWDENTEPTKKDIWVKGGVALEYNGKQWVTSKEISINTQYNSFDNSFNESYN